jgi:hypothetical protein
MLSRAIVRSVKKRAMMLVGLKTVFMGYVFIMLPLAFVLQDGLPLIRSGAIVLMLPGLYLVCKGTYSALVGAAGVYDAAF